MKAFFPIFVTVWVLSLFLPWWSVLFPALLFGAWLTRGSISAFLSGFFAAGLAWFLQALYIHLASGGILTGRIAEMTGLGAAWAILLITFMIAALPGGFAALTGFYFKVSLQKSDGLSGDD
ncbi:MAG: hypothetical protein EA360_02245 [Balneolaceae bacterium]|nr:MAG: hypothetical protein EA360_02245 [Balneolaceae bacterium]